MIQAEHQWPALCFKPAAQPSQHQAVQTSVVTVVCLDVESTTSTESEKHILEVLQD